METRDIKGFEDYLATKTGIIIQISKDRILPQYLDSNRNRPDNRYMRVNLWVNKKQSTQRVHRLVALAWLDNPNDYSDVDHIDRNKLNNNVNNLIWTTSSKNQINTDDRKSKWGRNINKHKDRWLIEFSRNGNRSSKSLPLDTPHEEVCKIRDEMKLLLDSVV